MGCSIDQRYIRTVLPGLVEQRRQLLRGGGDDFRRGGVPTVVPFECGGLRVKINNRRTAVGTLSSDGEMHGQGRFPTSALLTDDGNSFHRMAL